MNFELLPILTDFADFADFDRFCRFCRGIVGICLQLQSLCSLSWNSRNLFSIIVSVHMPSSLVGICLQLQSLFTVME
jgi:hypothetical protein